MSYSPGDLPVDVAKLSQAEQDRRRRERGQGGGARGRNIAIGVGVVVVLLAAGFYFAGDDPVVTGDSRDANMAAFGLEDDPYKGDPEADVVVVGFEAPRCSSCRAFHFTGLEDMDRDYFQPGHAVFYYVQYRISAEDLDIGIMQECALREAGGDGFWDLTDRIYSLEQYPSVSRAEQAYEAWADEAGVTAAAASCYEGRETSGAVRDDWDRGDDIGVPGTPTFYVFGAEGDPVRAHQGNLADVVADFVARA